MSPSANCVELFSPAKVNLFLAITGVRDDGFHALLSLVAPLQLGDRLHVHLHSDAGEDTMSCDFPGVPTGAENLVLRAAALLRKEVSVPGRFHFDLMKTIPAGAGLGGGSSNTAAALLGMNQLLGSPLDTQALCRLSAQLGSDCPLFIEGKATVMSGRGEVLEPLPQPALEALSGRRIILFRPDFGVSTAWAYGRMKANGSYYLPEEEAHTQLNGWLTEPTWDSLPLFNNLQDAVFEKFLALPALLQLLRKQHGLRCMMSGSGSCCFALPNEEASSGDIEATIKDALGENCFYADTRLG